MKKFSMRVVLIISVLFIAFGSANVSIAQERDTANKLPEVELGSLDTSNIIAEEVAQDKPAEVENLEEVPTTDELMQNPDVLEQPVADSDDTDLTVVSSGAYWTIYRNTVNNEYSLRMFGNVPSSKPSAWNSYLNRIKHIEIEEATLTGNFVYYFRGTVFPVLESVRIEQCNLSGVTSFDSAFYSSKTIKEVIIRDNDYPEAPLLTNTNSMFYTCSNLSKVDVSGLNTSSVTDMAYVFADATSLKELDLSNFDTSSVTTMRGMFANCTSLEELDLSNFDTSSVTDMSSMFSAIAYNVDLSNFDTSSVTTMSSMFQRAEVKELDVSSFDTSSVTDMQGMFGHSTTLEKLDLSNFDTSAAKSLSRMFNNSVNLKSLYLDKFSGSANFTDMFSGIKSLEYLRIGPQFNYYNGLENTKWYDEKNWVQFSSLSQLKTYNQQQSEPTGYRKGAFFSLTMDAMGGEFEDAEEQKVQNKVSGEYWDEIVPVKEDYYFDGWYLDQNFTNKFDFSLPAAVSTTIYAKWVENYTVVIPASISLNEASELKVEGINRGGKTLSVGLNYGKTTISENNKLTLANTADTTVQCLAPLSWDGSENNPENAILTLVPGSEITEGDAVMAIEAPENIQAGTYTGNLVFSINYE
ncbi:BspA family leucine-rich repeat surface protein [Listeria monocytogenes]|uniref:BspA family leucine-rich repeat surface protein n=1 Tax=Listeria monocytogenes TaxID=1639 RepID=A0A823GUN9_LISMN|nr:BspA family leucine-rich repeat surface protein [Listeria monocytogenes]EAC2391159.1 BspA family leucine-rich repeat surface protein [Listeria monocytogenes]EAC2412695.1 BspA family leucine-rich repeat surface protein [Listeria monocytogenes]EAC2490702.1 BspA family leucine-rich repeat surface protein [Listeria monocytogenes]EAC3313356.1 BspA family leucine-rich repeat surface protein [Listeria monocytogenes]EAC3368830.1 BspA family leucine-rich repeat surface protein [Listeria monocytogene